MSEFRADCPHCGTKTVAFELVASRRTRSRRVPQWDSLAICGYCARGILATFDTSENTAPEALLRENRRPEVVLKRISPSPPSTGAPEHTPDNVAEFYRQGMENLPGACDAAGSMFRKVLDTGLKAKFPDIKGKLQNRIKKAAEQHQLTPELAEWTHKIRLDGNDVAHEEAPFSKEDAETLQTFTELVLIYLFTLPGMLNEARGETEGEAGAPTESSS